jgi:hypothetical protein
VPQRVQTCAGRDACGARCRAPHVSEGLSSDRLPWIKGEDEPAVLDRKGRKVRRNHVDDDLR